MNGPVYHGVSTLGYSRFNQNTEQSGQNHLVVDTEWSRSVDWVDPNSLQIAGRYHYGDSSHYYGGKTEYRSPKVRMLANLQENIYSGAANITTFAATYSAELNTNIALADGEWSFGYDPVWQSGVLITLGGHEQVPVDVFVDGALVSKIQVGSPAVVYLAPFKTYHIAIMPGGSELYQFDRSARTVTLYQGNFAHLHWDLKTKIILFARIVDEKGGPVENALLESVNDFEATDAEGYLQADLIEGTQELMLKRQDQSICRVTLPAVMEEKDGLVQIDQLVCKAQQ